jgi:murein DD-endopeptidase MepM/ murein hydrolase activator NlpD
MNQNQKKLQMNRALSIALSLLVVVAVTVTVVAVVSARRAKPNDTTSESSSSTSQSTQKTQQTQQTETTSQTTPVVIEKTTFISPLTAGNVIKEWSADVPVFSSTMEDYRLHMGIDVAAEIASPVYAAADGTVEAVAFDPMMGQTVIISHANGYKSVYQNMQTAVPAAITVGATVKAGDEIGYVGDTALIEISEDPHLHFELYKDGVCENPLSHFTIAPIDPFTNYEDK